jgi:uncharacterized membrane protein
LSSIALWGADAGAALGHSGTRLAIEGFFIGPPLNPGMGTLTAKRSLGGEQVVEAMIAGALLGYAPPHGRKGVTARAAGAALLLAAFAPALTRQLLRIGAARRRVHLRTTVDIDQPVHEVFEFCRDFENFPRVVTSIHCVTDYQDGRSRWEVHSVSGEVLAWDAQVTKYVPNAVIAWRSLPGSVVDCNCLIRFSPLENGRTRLQIQVDYHPCHTGLSDAVRALFKSSGAGQIEADLADANTYLQSHPVSAPVEADDDADATTHSA